MNIAIDLGKILSNDKVIDDLMETAKKGSDSFGNLLEGTYSEVINKLNTEFASVSEAVKDSISIVLEENEKILIQMAKTMLSTMTNVGEKN